MSRSPRDIALGSVVRAFDVQAEWCERLGSPLYASLLRHARDDVSRSGVVAAVVADFDLDPEATALALRFMGGLHRLVMLGKAPALARHYPSVGGTPDSGTLGPDLLATVDEHVPYLTSALDIAPQTNEIGRCAALLPAIGDALGDDHRPVRLLEIGSAGGLNLMLDRYRYDGGSWTWGTQDAMPVIRAAWNGPPPSVPSDLHVVERRGCDVAPLDLTDPDERLRLLSFVWPDQRERFERTSAAIAAVSSSPPVVDRADAGLWLAERLAEPVARGVVTVVQHSVMWQYLSPQTQAAVTTSIETHGSAATDDHPFIHVGFEPAGRPAGRRGFVISRTRWPPGNTITVGYGHAHGAWIDWIGSNAG